MSEDKKSKRRLGCPECGGSGGYTEAVIDYGQGPFISCGWCDGTGEMTPEQRGEWLRWKKWEKRRAMETELEALRSECDVLREENKLIKLRVEDWKRKSERQRKRLHQLESGRQNKKRRRKRKEKDEPVILNPRRKKVNDNLTEIVCILDKSGSMDAVKEDARGGFNTFLKEQQELPGEARLSLVLFDTDYNLLHDNTPIAEVQELTEMTYRPGGLTALLDAVGKTIHTVGERLFNTNEAERPGQVIVCIITDGEENSSVEYNKSQVKELIERQQAEYSWKFIYLGANHDAFAEARGIGIRAVGTRTYTGTGKGTRAAYVQTSSMVTQARKTGSLEGVKDEEDLSG